MNLLRSRWVSRCGAVAGATAAVIAVTAVPASAETLGKWSRSVTGVSASGKASVSNGYIRTTVAVKDTVADGHCGYTKVKFQYRDAVTRLWFTSSEAKRRVCVEGTTKYATDEASVSQVARYTTDRIRVTVQVCREDALRDTCSDTYNSPSHEV